MKLNELLSENYYPADTNGVIGDLPVHLSMALEAIIKDGKITNNTQYFILASLIELFKNGEIIRWPRDLNAYEMSTNAELIDAVKSFTDAEAAAVTEILLSALQSPAHYEVQPVNHSFAKEFSNPELDIIGWKNWVLARQD